MGRNAKRKRSKDAKGEAPVVNFLVGSVMFMVVHSILLLWPDVMAV